jgi:hypothetical protein
MYHNIYAVCRKKSVKLFALTAIILVMHATVNAQSRYNPSLSYGGDGASYDWGISLSGGYDAPTGDLATTYKWAPDFAVSVLHNYGDFTFNATIGYVSYKPKLDTFYYDNTDPGAGYVKYSNFRALQFYVGAAYNIALTEQAKLYVGVNLGSYYTHFSFNANDGLGDEYVGDETVGQSYIAPKLGFNFLLNDNVTLGLEAKYNFLLSSSSGTGDTYDYGYTTSVSKTYSGNIVLTYNF